MAGSFNRVILMGNLTRDIELRYTPTNMAVGNFGLAVNRRYKANDGEMKEEVTFVDCEAWGRTAEIMGQYLGKGRPVFIEGRLKLDQWQDKESGGNRSKLKVVVENFKFVDSRADGAPPAGSAGGAVRTRPMSGGAPAAAAAPAADSYEQIDESDIPF